MQNGPSGARRGTEGPANGQGGAPKIGLEILCTAFEEKKGPHLAHLQDPFVSVRGPFGEQVYLIYLNTLYLHISGQ